MSLMKKFKVEPINSTPKNDMFYCNELPFGIISPNRFLNIETMNIISFYDEKEMALSEMACYEYDK